MRYLAENRDASKIERPRSHLRPHTFPLIVEGLEGYLPPLQHLSIRLLGDLLRARSSRFA